MEGGASPTGRLSPNGVDFTNETQATEFLEAMLNDNELKIIGNAYARYFWYGIVVAVSIAALFNLIRWATLHARSVDLSTPQVCLLLTRIAG